MEWRLKAEEALAMLALGAVLGYVFRSIFAFHHHPPYVSKVVSTTYKFGGKRWRERAWL